MFMHISCMHILSFLFLVVIVFLSLFLSLSDRLRKEPKARKSTPGQNPLQGSSSSSSSSSSSYTIPPPHVWFRDEKARKDFLENF